MRANDLVTQAVMEQSSHLVLCGTLKIEQVFNGIYIKRVPLQLETSWICRFTLARVMERRLYEAVAFTTLEHTRVEQVIDALIVYLQKRHVHLHILVLA